MATRARFIAHVHPETYQESDPLDWRTPQLHTQRAQCMLTACTFVDHFDDAQQPYIEAAKALRAEIAAAKRAAKRADGSAIVAPAETLAALAEVDAVEAAKAPTAAKPRSERRNETTHADGAAAVEFAACPKCKARKGAKCIRHDGERTNYVHGPRFAKWEAAVTA